MHAVRAYVGRRSWVCIPAKLEGRSSTSHMLAFPRHVRMPVHQDGVKAGFPAVVTFVKSYVCAAGLLDNGLR